VTYPYRLVDRFNQGWLTTDVEGVYQPGGYHPELAKMAFAEIATQRGPWRPVLPLLDDDEELLREAFRRSGRKTITTLAAALEVVFHDLRESAGGLNNPDSYDYAKRTMAAGREGSWESWTLHQVVLFGNGLNLPRPKRNMDNSIAARRARGPHSRVHRIARDVMADIFRRWVTGADRYTEVAETLAAVVARYIDEQPPSLEVTEEAMRDRHAGVAGWKTVADQWLQPGGMAHSDFATCYNLFYSTGAHFKSDLLG
jgi:hypothetical protein